MTDIRATLCAVCQGQRYPRQCRNSAAWRRAQHAPADCPFGVALGHLPIGDNMPASGLSGVFRGHDRCKHLTIVPTGGCCDNEFLCTWGGGHKLLSARETRFCRGSRVPRSESTSTEVAMTIDG